MLPRFVLPLVVLAACGQLMAADSRAGRAEGIANNRRTVAAPVQGAGTTARAATDEAADGSLVAYQDFYTGKNYELRQFNGIHVAFLLKDSRLSSFSMDDIRVLIGRWDRLYDQYQSLLGVEPPGEGLLKIAGVDDPTTSEAFLGYKGIQVDTTLAGATKIGSGDDTLYEAGKHGMADNFDLYSSFLFSGPDPARTWTTFIDGYIAVSSQEGSIAQPRLAAADLLNYWAERSLEEYLATPQASWATCVRDASCGTDDAKTRIAVWTPAGVFWRVAQLYGRDAIQGFYLSVSSLVHARSLVAANLSASDKSDLMWESLSGAAHADLSCFADQLSWPISPQLRSALGVSYSPSPFCQDRDNDGYSPFQGDLNDNNAAVYPNAPEKFDSVDNNLNGLVDETQLTGTPPPYTDLSKFLYGKLPFRYEGALAQGESAQFRTYVSISGPVGFRLRAENGLRGFLALLGDNGEPLPAADNTGSPDTLTVYDLPSGAWSFTANAYDDSPSGRVEVLAGAVAPRADADLAATPAESGTSGQFHLNAPFVPTAAAADPSATVRFWVDRVGWVGEVVLRNGSHVSKTASFDWTPPAGFDAAGHHYLYQVFNTTSALTPASAPAPLQAPAPQVEIDPGGVVNGASYRPGAISPDSWAVIFGQRLATAPATATTLPLPPTLGETKVTIIDSTSTEHTATLLYVSQTQINFLVPASAATGLATVRVETPEGTAEATVEIAASHPGLFSMNSDGNGPAAAYFLRFAPNGNQTVEPAFTCLQAGQVCTVRPISLNNDDVYLVLYGTGFRDNTTQHWWAAVARDTVLPVTFAGPHSVYAGLDQANIGPLPKSLTGKGAMDVELLMDQKQSNSVWIEVQ